MSNRELDFPFNQDFSETQNGASKPTSTIIAMEDCKGTLQITWRDAQSRTMFEGTIMGAWEREGDHAGAHALLEMESVNA